jgi:hypothetical protein
VFYRLAHHLDPMLFPLPAWCGYGLLTLMWLWDVWQGPRTPARSWWRAIVGASLLFAAGGLLAGWGPRPPAEMWGYEWRMHLLKFYPFRLADLLLPMAAAMMLADARSWSLSRRLTSGTTLSSSPGRLGLTMIIALATLLLAARRPQAERYEWVYDADWQAACAWVQQHTPAHAVVQTPHFQWTFKWLAQRPEYVNFKDCPQDAAGIVEWNRRLLLLTKWWRTHHPDGYSIEELRSWRAQTGITHLVTDRLGPIDWPAVYQNDSFRVYDLRTLDQPSSTL